VQLAEGATKPLEGTFLVGERRDGMTSLLDVVDRKPVAATGRFNAAAEVSTYRLVGPQFFMFFFYLMTGTGVVWMLVSGFLKEQTYVRQDD
jgi:hypothetical protein